MTRTQDKIMRQLAVLTISVWTLKSAFCQKVTAKLDLSSASCTDGLKGEQDNIVITTDLIREGVDVKEWPLSLVVETTHDKSKYYELCRVNINPAQCQSKNVTGCYCIYTVKNEIFTVLINKTSLPSLNRAFVRILWSKIDGTDSKFAFLHLPNIYPNHPGDLLLANTKLIETLLNCSFTVSEDKSTNVSFCIGENATSYDVALSFQGSRIAGANKTSKACTEAVFTPKKGDLPGNFTISYSKNRGCIREQTYTCPVYEYQEDSDCWCPWTFLPCPWSCFLALVAVSLIAVVFIPPSCILCCPRMICICCKEK